MSGARAASTSSAGSRPRSVSTAGWIPCASSRSSVSASPSSCESVSSSFSASSGEVRSFACASRKPTESCDEPLLGAIVKVSLETAALGVARLDDAEARGGELVPRVGARDREPDELREGLQAALGLHRQGLVVSERDDEGSPGEARDA